MISIIQKLVKKIINCILYIFIVIRNMFMPSHNKIIISIDGNIGSGKSTFLNLLKEKYNDKFYFAKEPVDQWLNIKGENLLEKFYHDKDRWSYTFQNYAYITRINELLNGIKSNKSIIITERSINTDKNVFARMLTEDKFMSEFEYSLYNTWFNHFNVKIDGQIYVRTELDNCVQRIQQRNRQGESTIDKEYLESLEKKHEDWLMNRNDILILDGNQNFKSEKFIQDVYLKLFDEYVSNLQKRQISNDVESMENIIFSQSSMLQN